MESFHCNLTSTFLHHPTPLRFCPPSIRAPSISSRPFQIKYHFHSAHCLLAEYSPTEDFGGGSCGDNFGGFGDGGHHGGHGNGDDNGNNDWFSGSLGEAYALLLLEALRKHAGSVRCKALMPALFLQLFLYRSINALADASKERGIVDEQTADAIFGVQGGSWTRIVIDSEKDEFVVDPIKERNLEDFTSSDHCRKGASRFVEDWTLQRIIKGSLNLARSIMLPEGYPNSVTRDYLEYSLWRMVQGIASQINGVLTTQALLYAVGLGKGAIPTAAAINWVLKDGVGYLSKILLAKYGRHFDVQPKGWRLLADLLENASYALEFLTPIYPNLFVYLGAAAGAGRSASGLIQGATRSCFYAGFAAQRNFAEVIAKGEAQGMVSKSVGILFGIVVSHYVGPSGPMLVATFLAVSTVHMFCNLRSYQAVHLRTLNPYRASLVFGEYIRREVIASVEEVNAEEPIFTGLPIFLFKMAHKDKCKNLLSSQTKEDAAIIVNKLRLGVSFSDMMRTQNEADELFKIYEKEKYILAERHNSYQVLLKLKATSHDLLKMILQVCYLHQLENGQWDLVTKNNIESQSGSPVELSYKLMLKKFGLLQEELVRAGWTVSDGLVSRPQSHRLVEALP